MTDSALIFVYNADGGIFNALTDLAHKTLSPATYACNLCALTYGAFGMRGEWKEFLHKLNRSTEFLHADELYEKYGNVGAKLPAVLARKSDEVNVLIDGEAINACRTLAELKELVLRHVN